mmetsp:Transcript_1640/g.2274  ORF Transcript_1640/g.2274 Transcript_1640/m.2274 type:complete len:153 (+) Transcript_1640:140-598(+)
MDGKRIKLLIWDTAGQERFRTITTSYFRGAQGILLVYDVTNRKSFDAIRNWIAQIEVHSDVNVFKVLIGNKCDYEDKRVVSLSEGELLAKEYGIKFFETSAKQNLNVDAAFTTITKDVKDRLVSVGLPNNVPGGKVQIGKANTEAPKKKSCC